MVAMAVVMVAMAAVVMVALAAVVMVALAAVVMVAMAAAMLTTAVVMVEAAGIAKTLISYRWIHQFIPSQAFLSRTHFSMILLITNY